MSPKHTSLTRICPRIKYPAHAPGPAPDHAPGHSHLGMHDTKTRSNKRTQQLAPKPSGKQPSQRHGKGFMQLHRVIN